MEKKSKPRPDNLENAEDIGTQDRSGKAYDRADWKAGGEAGGNCGR